MLCERQGNRGQELFVTSVDHVLPQQALTQQQQQDMDPAGTNAQMPGACCSTC